MITVNDGHYDHGGEGWTPSLTLDMCVCVCLSCPRLSRTRTRPAQRPLSPVCSTCRTDRVHSTRRPLRPPPPPPRPRLSAWGSWSAVSVQQSQHNIQYRGHMTPRLRVQETRRILPQGGSVLQLRQIEKPRPRPCPGPQPPLIVLLSSYCRLSVLSDDPKWRLLC